MLSSSTRNRCWNSAATYTLRTRRLLRPRQLRGIFVAPRCSPPRPVDCNNNEYPSTRAIFTSVSPKRQVSSFDSTCRCASSTDDTDAESVRLPTAPLTNSRLYRYLQLERFTPDEMALVFKRIVSTRPSKMNEGDQDDATADVEMDREINHSNLTNFLLERISELELESDISNCGVKASSNCSQFDAARLTFAKHETSRILALLSPTDDSSDRHPTLNQSTFIRNLTTHAASVDSLRTAPVVASMLLVGASVGVITPAMPFVVQELQLTASQYGAAVSAFGLAKMLGNVPAAVAVERHGRKPYMTYSLVVLALGVGGIGLAHNFEALYACRLCTGLGVAALSTAGTLMITDLSTPLNRASTMAPVMSAFAAGTALGPALGGILVDSLGLHPTFYCVGMSYLGVAVLNRFILRETQRAPLLFPWQLRHDVVTRRERSERETETVRDAIQGAVGQWIPLLQDSTVRSVMIMNGLYWIALAGSQMTLLPLMLTDANGLAFSATQVGQVYMGMSLVQIVGNPVFARVSDRVGPAPVITGATTVIGSAMALLPYACGHLESVWPLAATLAMWSTGSSMLSTAPLAFVSGRVDDVQRAQAIALLRTCGDVGLLIGATGTGAMADWCGSLDIAMQSSAGLLLTATGWFAARQVLTSRLNDATSGTTRP